MSTVLLQVGQCGNQLGLEWWRLIMQSPGLGKENDRSPFITRDGKLAAVFVDSEPKVLRGARHLVRSKKLPEYNVIAGKGGRGSNWAYGYHGQRGEEECDILQQTMDALRREVERRDCYCGTILFHSLSGGTGSGLGARLCEEIREEFPVGHILSVSVAPYQSGESPLQHYNTLLSLLMVFSCFVMTKLLPWKRPSEGPAKRANDVCCCSGLSLGMEAWELLRSVCPQPAAKLLHTTQACSRDMTHWNSLASTSLQALPNVSPVGKLHSSRAVLAVARGVQDSTPLTSTALQRLRRGHRCVPWNPFPIDLWTDPRDPLGCSASSRRLTVCSNHSSVSDLLCRVMRRSGEMIRAGAYLHWYQRYGVEAEEFRQALDTLIGWMDLLRCCCLCFSMAVVIRLQGLRMTAGSEDIRGFFTGLKIPDGGVHIIGGPLEEAFIIFASDDDARRAMTRSGGCIKGTPVNLLLSSKAEMQYILEENTKKSEMNKNRAYNDGFRRAEPNTAPPNFTKNLSVEVRRMDHMAMGGMPGAVVEKDMHIHQTRKTLPSGNESLYLHLQGLPFSISRGDVRMFFQGLQLDDIILMKNHRGQNNGMGIVKFATFHDANEGLKRDREYIGNRFIEVKACSEKQWVEAGGSVATHLDHKVEFLREPPPAYAEKRYGRERTRSTSPAPYRSRSSSPASNEYCVLMENLSYSAEKRDIMEFFYPVQLKEDQILHLHERSGKRTRAAFVLFRSLKDYCAGLSRHKELLAYRAVHISPISKEKMVAMLESMGGKNDQYHERAPEKPSTSLDRSQRSQRQKYESERSCIYVRNLPFDVRKVEIVDFFQGFGISEEMVYLLCDEKGSGLGEALVTFHSEGEALRAESLNGQRFLGSEVMLKCISRMQMQEFGIMEDPRKNLEVPLRTRSPEVYADRHGEGSRFPLDGEYQEFGVPADVHVPISDLPDHPHGRSSRFDSHKDGRESFNAGDGFGQRGLGNPGQQFDGPACVKLINLPVNISIDEIYDFCYGYRLIPGSVSLQYNKNGIPKGCATVVFESRQEALTAIQELSGRPIGTKKIRLLFV
ncbi:hypothetical protein JZ751_028255 [Albula glossodonta]|uniref:RRM domain-containing protein n=1 Tax=Albula glossodonta TaxID=121402 RepID=A0A8T2NMY9_9TELE|nr:hypothetical protein JZ751_028255 [Albula glossodonta]